MLKMLSSLSLVAILLQINSLHGQPEVADPDIRPSPAVIEGDTFQACFYLTETPSMSPFQIAVSNNTPDISEINNVLLTFPMGLDASMENAMCIDDILALDDNNIESTENFMDMAFRITTTYNGVTTPERVIGSIFILDIIGATVGVGFEQPAYTFVEGSSNMICVTLEGVITQDGLSLNVPFQVVADTAGISDYTTVPGVDSFLVTTGSSACITVSINIDSVAEGVEMFTVLLLSAQSPLVLLPGFNSTEITIIDIDANCGPPPEFDSDELDVMVSQPSAANSTGTLVVNEGATANYTCVEEDFVLVGNVTLTCVMTDSDVEWYPSAAPICEEAPVITDDPTTTEGIVATEVTTDAGRATTAALTMLTQVGLSAIAFLVL